MLKVNVPHIVHSSVYIDIFGLSLILSWLRIRSFWKCYSDIVAMFAISLYTNLFPCTANSRPNRAFTPKANFVSCSRGRLSLLARVVTNRAGVDLPFSPGVTWCRQAHPNWVERTGVLYFVRATEQWNPVGYLTQLSCLQTNDKQLTHKWKIN